MAKRVADVENMCRMLFNMLIPGCAKKSGGSVEEMQLVLDVPHPEAKLSASKCILVNCSLVTKQIRTLWLTKSYPSQVHGNWVSVGRL